MVRTHNSYWYLKSLKSCLVRQQNIARINKLENPLYVNLNLIRYPIGHINQHAVNGHWIPQSARRANSHCRNQQRGILGHICSRDGPQNNFWGTIQVHFQWIQRLRWSHCYSKVRFYKVRILCRNKTIIICSLRTVCSVWNTD